MQRNHLKFRHATIKDLPAIIAMLADDKLGKLREHFDNPLPVEYILAYKNIAADDNQELIVLEDSKEEVIGTLQLTFLQYLTYRGGIRAQIEAVRIRKDKRGLGIGTQMFAWAINRAKERQAHVLQLTTDKKRPETIKFYKELGFNNSHEGMKLNLIKTK